MDVLSGSECSSWLPWVTWKFSLAAVSAKWSIKSHWWSKKEGFSREQMSIWRRTPPPSVVSFDGCLVWVAPLVWSCHGLPLWFFFWSLSMNIACWTWKMVETRMFLWHDDLVVCTTSVDGQIWRLIWVVRPHQRAETWAASIRELRVEFFWPWSGRWSLLVLKCVLKYVLNLTKFGQVCRESNGRLCRESRKNRCS